MELDLCMWAKDGAKFLEPCLMSIEKQGIPAGNKIFIDDNSQDKTTDIARSFGWKIYKNPNGGISSGFKEALSHVATEWYCGFEQDVILAPDWWKKISKYIYSNFLDYHVQRKLGVVQGVRISTNLFLRYADPPMITKAHFIQKGDIPHHFWSIDNNVFNTEKIREATKHFSDNFNLFTDYYLKTELMNLKYSWHVDPDIVSLHQRGSTQEYLHKFDSYIKNNVLVTLNITPEQYNQKNLVKTYGKRILKLPILIPYLAIKNKYPMIFISYPYFYLNYFKLFMKYKKQDVKT